MFRCLPNKSKCEWQNLSSFVDAYNRVYGKNYIWSECLDNIPRDRPNPECRLTSPGDKDIVLEHKIIVWPPDHLRQHSAHHDFMKAIASNLNSHFQETFYILEANASDLVPKKRKVENWALNISEQIVKKKNLIKVNGYITGIQPIRWIFRQISDTEKEEDMPEKGVGVALNFIDPAMIFSDDDEAEMIGGVKEIFLQHLEKTVNKFDGYDKCIKIFITEIYSDNYLLDHESIDFIAKEVSIPECIDQIWVGYPVWISETEYKTGYTQVDFHKT